MYRHEPKNYFAALPVNTCPDNLTFSDLENHEYFGQDFIDRKNSVALAIDETTGKLNVIWSYGSWESFIRDCVKPYAGNIVLVHTQTGRKKHLRLITYFMHGTKEHRYLMEQQPDVKLKNWTLK